VAAVDDFGNHALTLTRHAHHSSPAHYRQSYHVVEVPLRLFSIDAASIRCSSSSILQGHGTICHNASRASSRVFGEDVVSSNTGILASLMVSLSAVKRPSRCKGLSVSLGGVSSKRRMPSNALGSFKDEAGKTLTS